MAMHAIIPLNLTFKIVVNIHYDFSFFGNTHREALPYRESKNMTKQRQGPNQDVQLRKMSNKGGL